MKKILPLLAIAVLVFPTLVLAQPAPVSPPDDVDPWEVILKITEIAFGALIAVAVIVLVIAGFFFLTAGGDENKITKARTMLLYAVVGIVIAILSQGLVNYLQDFLTN